MKITAMRILRASTTSVIILAAGATLAPTSAFAADPSWRPIDPGQMSNGKPSQLEAPGYTIDGVLGYGETDTGRYPNKQNGATGAYCIIAGLPVSEAAQINNALDGQSDPVVAYALSMYGASQDRDTTAAVSLIAHTFLDQGTSTVTAQERRAAFQEAYGTAPAGVKAQYDKIVGEARAYKAPDAAALATDVKIVGSVDGGDLAAQVNVPDGHATVVTITGAATFEDGSQSMTVDADQTLKLVATKAGQGQTLDATVTADPKDDSVTEAASAVQTYRQEGVNEQGRPYQVMAWAVPNTVALQTANARVEWKTPYTPPSEMGSDAADKADGDKVVAPGGVVQDTFTYGGTGINPGTKYTLETTIIDMATGKSTDLIGGGEFTPTSTSGSTVTTVAIPKDFPEGKYAVTQALKDPTGAVLAIHDGTKAESQQFTVGAPKIGTTATDGADGDKYITNVGGLLTDTISYENVPVGKELTFTGTVMDKETGEALKGEDGNDLTASAKYTPTTASGTAEVKFTLSGSAAGKTLVVFEDVTDADGTVIAEHKDINDEGQTVFVGKVGTNATDQADGDKTLLPGGTIIDVADYSNLPGGTMRVDAQLVAKADGKPVEGASGSSTVDVKEREAGQVQTALKVPGSLADGDYVVFETFYDKDGHVVAEHRDLTAASQTVTVRAPKKVTPPVSGPQVHTGGDAQGQELLAGGIGLSALALGGGAFALRRRKGRSSSN